MGNTKNNINKKRRHSRQLRWRATAALGAAVATVCGLAMPSASAAGQSPSILRIPLISTFNGLPFYTATLCGMEVAAKIMGGRFDITSLGPPHGEDVAEQLPLLQSEVNSKPSGIVLVPADTHALVVPTEAAEKAGIPVVTTDQILAKPVALASFTTNDVAGGTLAAKALLDALHNKRGAILVLDNKPGLPVTNERAEGFIAAMKKLSGFKILPTLYNDDTETTAESQVESSMTANPNIVGIFATAEAGALGAAAAMQAHPSYAKKVKLIAYDADTVEVQALRRGEITALIAQGSYWEGFEAMRTLVEYIRGELTKSEITYLNIEPETVVTASNVDNPAVTPFLYPRSCPKSDMPPS